MGKKKVVQQSPSEPSVASRGASSEAAPAAKQRRKIQSGRIYIQASYNNTIITATDAAGNVLAWASAGSLGFSGPKKATPFASSKVVAVIAERLKATGPTDVDVIVRGVSSGRDAAIRSLINQGFNVTSLKDATPIPHNGPRPRKVRRV